MKQKLLDYIVCPKCKNRFDLKTYKQQDHEIMEGSLNCSECDAVFPITGGVPRILSSELESDKQATARAFGYEWKHFTEFTDKYKDQFLSWINPVTKEFFQGKTVLDAGCGKGRHLYLAAKFGAKDAIGIDLSEASEVAFAHTRHMQNAHVIQADIYNLPFEKPFDYIYSIGVLHHLPEPKNGFLSLVRHLKDSGTISAWVYGREGNWWIEKIVSPIRTGITSKLPNTMTQVLAFAIAVLMQTALKAVYRPVNLHLKPLRKILFYNDYLFSISDYSFRENFSIVFDHLVAPTAFYIAKEELETWFTDAKLKDVTITQRNSNSWRGTGKKQ